MASYKENKQKQKKTKIGQRAGISVVGLTGHDEQM